jgi:hypothetical protein
MLRGGGGNLAFLCFVSYICHLNIKDQRRKNHEAKCRKLHMKSPS